MATFEPVASRPRPASINSARYAVPTGYLCSTLTVELCALVPLELWLTPCWPTGAGAFVGANAHDALLLGAADCYARALLYLHAFLSTEPGAPTHWAQQVFLVSPGQAVQQGDVLEGAVSIRRQKQNHRLLWVQVTFTHSRAGVGQIGPERTMNYRID